LGAAIFSQGNELHLQTQDDSQITLFQALIKNLQDLIQEGHKINYDLVNAVVDSLREGENEKLGLLQNTFIAVPQTSNRIYPRSYHQAKYIQGMEKSILSFGLGPAGTGKTYLAVAHALSEVLTKKRKKLILTRPVVEAGENLGFLPGDLSQKISPYLRPLYDAIEDLLPPELIAKMEDNRMIEVAPLAYMRGRSLKNCYVVLDEAQNTTKPQMKMFLTRIGENARVVVTGDPSQSDLPGNKTSGLIHAQRVLGDLMEISFTHFHRRDVVRHPLVKKIIEAYEQE
jgi:phosphate starvation-inducible PhoH-like protein